jgi:DNA-binding NarL/FixJ family response regulator
MIRIIIADDHALILQGLRALLQTADDIELLAECCNGSDALEMIRHHSPDVAVLDISMPGIDGITLASQLAVEQPRTAVVILSTHDDPVLYEQAGNVGVYGYVLKNTAFEVLLDTIRLVASGKNLMAPRSSYPPDPARSFVLTDREREVLGLIANGLTNRMIAENLKISINTVDRHRSNLMTKLGLHSTAELVRYAIKTGII